MLEEADFLDTLEEGKFNMGTWVMALHDGETCDVVFSDEPRWQMPEGLTEGLYRDEDGDCHLAVDTLGDLLAKAPSFECDTQACFAGWVCMRHMPDLTMEMDIPEAAKEYLDLTDDQAGYLFYGISHATTPRAKANQIRWAVEQDRAGLKWWERYGLEFE